LTAPLESAQFRLGLKHRSGYQADAGEHRAQPGGRTTDPPADEVTTAAGGELGR
jgi:hypothetical protein